MQKQSMTLSGKQLSQLHSKMVRAYRNAQDAVQQSYQAYNIALNAKGDLFMALAEIEALMLESQSPSGSEAHASLRQLRGNFDCVTLDL